MDRAALDAAMAAGVPVGGWCPKGRRAEDGVISEKYPLLETPETLYEQRTSWNVRDSDATLIVTRKQPSGGTAKTVSEARRQGRPLLIVAPENTRVKEACSWLDRHHVRILNVAGPRESTEKGIYEDAFRFLQQVIAEQQG